MMASTVENGIDRLRNGNEPRRALYISHSPVSPHVLTYANTPEASADKREATMEHISCLLLCSSFSSLLVQSVLGVVKSSLDIMAMAVSFFSDGKIISGEVARATERRQALPLIFFTLQCDKK